MIRKVRRLSGVAALVGLAVFAPVRAQAGLTLTAAGVTDGFTLSTYATGSAGNYSFIAAAPLSNGTLAVIDYAHGNLRSYADVDGQTYGSALQSVPFGSAVNIADAGGVTYATRLGVSNGLYSVSNSLALTPVAVTGGFRPAYGFAGNPVSGHLLAFGTGSAGAGIYDINPLTGANSLIASGGGFDGVSVSPDGKTVYVENGGRIQGYNIATHVLGLNVAPGHSPDGTGAISGGLFNGFVIVNNNDGTVGLLDPTTGLETIIASGGTRGDFTSPDTNNGTLLLSEYDFSYRLRAPGGTFGITTPEPATLGMLGIGIVGTACYCVRRRKRTADSSSAA